MRLTISFVVISVMLFISACAKPVFKPQATIITEFDCQEPNKNTWWVGDRAFIDTEGSKLVLQCGSGDILSWENSQSLPLGHIPLALAAAHAGIIPKELECFSSENDCDLIDHTSDWSSYITWNNAVNHVLTPNQAARQVPGNTSAVLLPHSGPALNIINGTDGFKSLELRSIESWTARPLLTRRTPVFE